MTAAASLAAAAPGARAATAPLIDGDVRVTWRSAAELSPYLPRVWHNRLTAGRGEPRIQPAFYLPFKGAHPDAAPGPAGPPGSDPQTVLRDWLDPHGIAYAVVGHEEIPVISTWGDLDYPVALARAHNEWLVEHWLERDRRFLGAIVVATQDPRAAAAEIDRAGAHPQVVQVVLAAGTRQAYGAPAFHPIYEAAARHGLQVALRTGTEGLGTSNPPTSAGWPTYAIEWRATQAQNLAAHLVSLVTEGVFVAHPDLHVVLLDGGAAWLPPLLWRLDKNFKSMRAECPWLTELPSRYLLRNVRFGTHRLERPEGEGAAAGLWTYLRAMDGARTLLFTSGYPSWDREPPADCFALQTAAQDAPGTARRIGYENAAGLYGAKLAGASGGG
ncbi:MAG TPA: amidohydrolase family protein [Chloroflexota bacterium]|nr:amidohydrolase family protein [Chloroflexota bacterium]